MSDDNESQPQELSLNLIVSVPSMTRAMTRGDLLPFDEDRESRVGETAVIFFDRDENGESTEVVMVAPGKFQKRDELTPTVYTFKVSVYAPDPDEWLQTTYNAMVIANANAEAMAVKTGMTPEEVRGALVRTNPILPRDEETPLPMWGELEEVHFPGPDESTTPTYSTSLLRACARVDITIDSEIEEEQFELFSVSIVNSADRMAIVPDPENIEPHADLPGHWHAIKPTVPEGTISSLRWDYDSIARGNNISHTVYIPESLVRMGNSPEAYPGDANHTRRTAVVIGGRWQQSDSLQYYRMDFISQEGDTLVDIRRNHLYTFRITKIDCEGAESVEAAYNDPVQSIGASLIDWFIPYKALTYQGDDWISATHEVVNLPGNACEPDDKMKMPGVIVDVKSSLPLTTFRVKWQENEESTYHSDRTESVEGVEAEVFLKGDIARVVIANLRENPEEGDPRVCKLVMRVTPALKIILPVIVHPLNNQGWEGNNPLPLE